MDRRGFLETSSLSSGAPPRLRTLALHRENIFLAGKRERRDLLANAAAATPLFHA
jgi:hypothetical protein